MLLQSPSVCIIQSSRTYPVMLESKTKRHKRLLLAYNKNYTFTSTSAMVLLFVLLQHVAIATISTNFPRMILYVSARTTRHWTVHPNFLNVTSSFHSLIVSHQVKRRNVFSLQPNHKKNDDNVQEYETKVNYFSRNRPSLLSRSITTINAAAASHQKLKSKLLSRGFREWDITATAITSSIDSSGGNVNNDAILVRGGGTFLGVGRRNRNRSSFGNNKPMNNNNNIINHKVKTRMSSDNDKASKTTSNNISTFKRNARADLSTSNGDHDDGKSTWTYRNLLQRNRWLRIKNRWTYRALDKTCEKNQQKQHKQQQNQHRTSTTIVPKTMSSLTRKNTFLTFPRLFSQSFTKFSLVCPTPDRICRWFSGSPLQQNENSWNGAVHGLGEGGDGVLVYDSGTDSYIMRDMDIWMGPKSNILRPHVSSRHGSHQKLDNPFNHNHPGMTNPTVHVLRNCVTTTMKSASTIECKEVNPDSSLSSLDTTTNINLFRNHRRRSSTVTEDIAVPATTARSSLHRRGSREDISYNGNKSYIDTEKSLQIGKSNEKRKNHGDEQPTKSCPDDMDLDHLWWPPQSVMPTSTVNNVKQSYFAQSSKLLGDVRRVNLDGGGVALQATTSALSSSWRVRRYRKRVGYGPDVYEACRDAALNWEFQSESNDTGMIMLQRKQDPSPSSQSPSITGPINSVNNKNSNNNHCGDNLGQSPSIPSSNKNFQQIWCGPGWTFVTYTSVPRSLSMIEKRREQETSKQGTLSSTASSVCSVDSNTDHHFSTSIDQPSRKTNNNIESPSKKHPQQKRQRRLKFPQLRPCVYVMNPVQVVYDVVDQRGGECTGGLINDSSVSSSSSLYTSTAFGTLKGHAICGEERVTICYRDDYNNENPKNSNHHHHYPLSSWNSNNKGGPVDIEILSYSKPSDTLFGKIAWPFFGSAQDRFFRQQLQALERVATQATITSSSKCLPSTCNPSATNGVVNVY